MNLDRFSNNQSIPLETSASAETDSVPEHNSSPRTNV